MGREVRRVPADWQHPKNRHFNHHGQVVENYQPLRSGCWADQAKKWDEGREKWERGEFPDYASEESRQIPFDQWEGQRPYSADYMPAWTPEQATHLMMYEDTSEGTPISPAFATPEELARWCVANGASIFGSAKACYEDWLAIASGGFCPGIAIDPSNGIAEPIVARQVASR